MKEGALRENEKAWLYSRASSADGNKVSMLETKAASKKDLLHCGDPGIVEVPASIQSRYN